MSAHRCKSALGTIEEHDFEKVALAHRRRASSSSESASVQTASSLGTERCRGEDVVWSTPSPGLRYTAVLGNRQNGGTEEQERRIYLTSEDERHHNAESMRHAKTETAFTSGRMDAERFVNNNLTSRHLSPCELGSDFYDSSTQRATMETRRTVRMEREEREMGQKHEHRHHDEAYPEPKARTIPIRRIATAPSAVFDNVSASTLHRDHYERSQKSEVVCKDTRKCDSCEVLLTDMLSFLREGKYYCQRHCDAMSRSHDFNTGYEQSNLKHSSTKLVTPPRCAGCHELIFDRDLLMANGAFWHREHFRCGVCNETIGTGLYRVAQKEACCCRCSRRNNGRVVKIERDSMCHGNEACQRNDTRYVLCSKAQRIQNTPYTALSL